MQCSGGETSAPIGGLESGRGREYSGAGPADFLRRRVRCKMGATAIRGAVLPPLPDKFSKDDEVVTFRFKLAGFPSEEELKRSLYAAIRERGY